MRGAAEEWEGVCCWDGGYGCVDVWDEGAFETFDV